MQNTKPRAARAIEMSVAGKVKWQQVLSAKGIGTATELMSRIIERAPEKPPFVNGKKVKTTIESNATALRAITGQKIDKRVWELIFKCLELNGADFFPSAEWFDYSREDLWEMLRDIAADGSDRFGLVIPDPVEYANVRNALGKNQPKYPRKFPINTKVMLEIEAGWSGELILLEQNTDGRIDLVSPSVLMQDNLLTGKIQYLPQTPLPEWISDLIPLEPVGTRHLWAGIFAQLPEWGWLQGSREDVLELQVEQLADLLAYAEQSPEGCRMWKTSYEVV